MYLDVYTLFFFKEWYQYAGLFPLLCIWIVFLFLVDSGSQHWQHRPRPDVLGGDGCVRSHAGSRAETRERLFTCQREKQGRNHTRENHKGSSRSEEQNHRSLCHRFLCNWIMAKLLTNGNMHSEYFLEFYLVEYFLLRLYELSA